MEHGWDGVGFLLRSLKQDRFEALAGCLQAQKYSIFIDLLQSVPQELVTKTDIKGRNLLLILARYVEDLGKDSQEFKKALQVIDMLQIPVSNKPTTLLGQN